MPRPGCGFGNPKRYVKCPKTAFGLDLVAWPWHRGGFGFGVRGGAGRFGCQLTWRLRSSLFRVVLLVGME